MDKKEFQKKLSAHIANQKRSHAKLVEEYDVFLPEILSFDPHDYRDIETAGQVLEKGRVFFESLHNFILSTIELGQEYTKLKNG